MRTDIFRKILSTGILPPPEKCDVFDEWLLYLFYGRPAYKIRCDSSNQRVVDEYLPVAMIFDAGAVTNIKRLFPFDSGAFAGGAYRSVHADNVTFRDFELPAAISSAKKVVRAFFGSNADYFTGQASQPVGLNPFDDPEVLAYHAILDGPSNVEIDDRRYSIEIQTEDSISLSPHLLAIVMPHTWLESDTIRTYLAGNPAVKPLTYCRFKGISLSASHAVILERVHDFLSSRGDL
jgi:hypothetical protein